MFVKLVEDINRILEALSYEPSVGLHGQMTREEKTANLAKWKKSKKCLLVATTAAAQGVDHAEVSCVVVLRDPEDTNVLVQMVGRGSRGGKVECSCYLHSDTKKASWFLKHPQCIRKALYTYVDGAALGYTCNSRDIVSKCEFCATTEPSPTPFITPASAPPALPTRGEDLSKIQSMLKGLKVNFREIKCMY